MKQLIRLAIYGRPIQGENIIDRQPKLHTIYPTRNGSPLGARVPFNEWIGYIQRSFWMS